jgi:hypothetical protein
MRATWLLVIVCAAGCMRPHKTFAQRARDLRDKLASLRFVAPPAPVLPALPAGLPPPTTIRISNRPPPRDRAADPDPRPRHEPGPTSGPRSGGESPAPRSQTIYARFQFDGKWLCEAHPDADGCTRSCNERFALALKMGASTSCECTSEKRCDEMTDH